MSDTERVLVFAETDESGNLSRLTYELMGLGGWLALRLSGQLEAVTIGEGIANAAEELLSLGARRVFAADAPALAKYNPDSFLEVLAGLLEGMEPVTVIAGHTPVGQDLMPRLAFALEAGLVTDCTGIEVDDPAQGPVFIKPVFGGNAMASLSVATPLRIATVRARVGAEVEPGSGDGEVVQLDIPTDAPRIDVRETVQEARGVMLESCRVVVSGGRGIGGAEGFEQIEELAGLLGGAVGASRPPCDSGWIPSTQQVGITGKIVAPDLYIAVAISGSSQHLSGMSESAKVVAINQDPEAYIFKVSDFGVVGDWKQVVPAFAAALEKYVEG